ncbi:MAG: hypothetical protein ABIX44_03130 [Cryobacterium sp.]
MTTAPPADYPTRIDDQMSAFPVISPLGIRSRLLAWPVGRHPDAVIVGLVGFLLSVAASWRASVWFDEAATISAATRSWPELMRMLGNVDAVHGLYYAGMHLWLDLVGYSPFTLRLPSAVATGITAALIVLLMRSLGPRPTAILSGLAFCLLPRVTWMGAEGRSYALTTTLAVALTLVFLAAWRRGGATRAVRARWWMLYGLLAVVVTSCFLYLALLVVAHGITAAWTHWSAHRSAATAASLGGWLLASMAAGAALIPFAIDVADQSGQVSWIGPVGRHTLHGVFVTQWFYKNPAFAATAWALIAVGLAVLARRGRRQADALPARVPSVVPSANRPAHPSLASIVLPWLVVPTVGIILASIVVSPLYSPRYLTYSAPAAAILIGVAVSALRSRSLVVVAMAGLVVLAAPQYLAQRMPEAKQQSSWGEVAALVSAQRALEPADTHLANTARANTAEANTHEANTAEAIIYGPVRQHPAATTRVIAYAYPEAFSGLTDVKLAIPAAETGRLWETRYPLDQVTGRLEGADVVWLVTSTKQDWRPSVTRHLAALGYGVDAEWSLTGVNVLRYER